MRRCRCVPPPPHPPPEPWPAPRGRLSVQTWPWARVRLDGRDLGVTPLYALHVDAGRHTLELVSSCGTRTEPVVIPPRGHVRVRLRLCPRR
ncbi:MAG: PEGA domain-containing protein [Myxococcota bacterium]|nr:PEGA domain-containing protein [Myxococcota bacterium]MDW8363862.1 PEGA domain-containing protein [Myxococcales bacterium]